MISKKAKLLGGLSILLGAPSGASLATSSLGSFSLNNWFSSLRGGAKNISLDDGAYSLESKELDLDNKVNQLTISKSQEVENMELEEVQSQPIDLSNEQTVNDQDQAPTIRSIYSENVKEGKTLTLDQNSTAKVQEFTAKSSKWIDNYNSARAKLGLSRSSAGNSKRRKRSAVVESNFSKLSREEREALWEMLKLFEDLEKERNDLIPQFKKIDDNLTIDITQIASRPNRNTIETHLNKMDWITKEKVKYENPPPKPRWPQRAPNLTANSSYWTDWNKNPYQSFMNRTDYESFIKKIKRAEAEKQIQQRAGKFRRGIYLQVYYPTQEDKQREKDVEKAKEDIVQKVALQLLNWMGQSKQLTF